MNTTGVDGGSVMTTTLSNLAPSTAYSIEVAAVNDGGTGEYSEPLIEETLPSKWIKIISSLAEPRLLGRGEGLGNCLYVTCSTLQL